jgi:hypothetical protein
MYWWYLAVNTTIKINRSNCSHWFYLIVATCFGPHLGPSSGSLIKYFSCYWTVIIWIHILLTWYPWKVFRRKLVLIYKYAVIFMDHKSHKATASYNKDNGIWSKLEKYGELMNKSTLCAESGRKIPLTLVKSSASALHARKERLLKPAKIENKRQKWNEGGTPGFKSQASTYQVRLGYVRTYLSAIFHHQCKSVYWSTFFVVVSSTAVCTILSTRLVRADRRRGLMYRSSLYSHIWVWRLDVRQQPNKVRCNQLVVRFDLLLSFQPSFGMCYPLHYHLT